MASNIVPEKTINFNVFLNGRSASDGVTTIDLPDFTAITETIEGAGIMGQYDAATIGHFENMSATLNFRQIVRRITDFMRPGTQQITLRAAQQGYNRTAGTVDIEGLRIELTAGLASGSMGELTPAAASNTSIEVNIVRIAIFWGDEKRLEIDKPNYVYFVNGRDYMAEVRRILGM